jgi:D-amino peptidase
VKKVYLHTDIEGVAGWVFYQSPKESVENHFHQQRMRQLLTNEVDAACQAALDRGVEQVWINDSHGNCYNLLFEQLPKQCQVMHGRGGHFDAWLSCFDATVDALACIGMHAMAGTPYAVNAHSLWHINNDAVCLSECTMAAALAGCHGVPCVCVSGDDKVTAEVKSKLPQAETAVVKWGLALQNARTLTPDAACELIYRSVRAGLDRRDEIPPYRIPGPYRINISDRDPAVRILPQDVEGTDFWETVHRALNQTTYCRFGNECNGIDDRTFRWP